MRKQIGNKVFYDTAGAAEVLDVVVDTVRRLIRDGTIRATRFSGKYWITEEELQRLYSPSDEREAK